MLLAVDAGNTDTVIGLYDLDVDQPTAADDGLTDHWRIATHAERTSDEHAVMFMGFLAARRMDWRKDIEGVVISSGVPRVMANLRNMTERWLGKPAVVLEPGTKTGVAIRTDNPKEVGADRIANAVAAHEAYGSPCIVVDFGTATTFDAISDKGEYLGGAICPGIEVSANALFARAALLRRVELAAPKSVIGRSTVEAVQSGLIHGYAGQTDHMVDLFRDELGGGHVVGTGGLATVIAHHCETIEHVDPWLTLRGLRIVHDRNQ